MGKTIPRKVTSRSRKYPRELRHLECPPKCMWLLGRDIPGSVPRVGIVGSRNCTAVGYRFARQLATELARSGVCVVSGMARGIDSAAHLGALEGSASWPDDVSPTVAVLGCGVDVVYPASNRELYSRLLARGTVLSELEPSTEALPQHFPVRNRIIAALSSVVVVVEAGRKSGSLHTVDFALAMGREVMAVPGSVHSSASEGTNYLIKNGAGLVDAADDVLDVLDLPGAFSASPPEKLSPDEGMIVELVGKGNVCLDDLAQDTGKSAGELALLLTNLELRGVIARLPGGLVALNKRMRGR